MADKAANPIRQAQAAVCDRIGANIYGRVAVFIDKAERGDNAGARAELLALLKFFPRA
jgi:hypothetical protein